MATLLQAWPAIRSSLQAWGSYDIKEIVGFAGLDLTALAHLEQKAQGGASKGQLMTAVDKAFGSMARAGQSKFLSIAGEEILRRKSETEQQLSENLSRHGWAFSEGGHWYRLKCSTLQTFPSFPKKLGKIFSKRPNGSAMAI